MYQDYLLRMISQLRLFMAGIMRKRDEGDLDGAITDLREGYGLMTGLSASLVNSISEEDLLNLLTARGGIDAERGIALAELMREEGALLSEAGRVDEIPARYLKSLRLYLEVDDLSDDPTTAPIPQIDYLAEKMRDTNLTPRTGQLLAGYFERAGQFDKAENLLVEQAESLGDWQPLIRFYQNLLLKDSAELLVGGVTTDEVAAGLAWAESSTRSAS